MGERAAEPFVEEEEEQRKLCDFRRETVGVPGPVTLQQAVTSELAQIVAQLVQAIGFVGDVECCENSLWMGEFRLKMKLRQYSIWAIA